jgi:hypothetical protein
LNDLESQEVLLQALQKLDDCLEEQGIASLEIRIVGGFALIVHGIRDTGFTQDIDSMTREFAPDIKATIAKIGKEMGIKLGWLNADMVLDDPEIIRDIVGELVFESYDEFKVLQVSVASLPSLLRLKLVAAGDNLEITNDEVEFERHFEDVKALMRALDISSAQQLATVAPHIADYPELQAHLFDTRRPKPTLKTERL